MKIDIKHEFHLFLTAMLFFTRIPCASWFDYSETYLNKSSRYLPLIGIIVGGAGAAIFWLANLIFSDLIAVLLSMISTILITGAFHEDGFADCCDGFGGGWTKEQILSIMKDSRIGTFGAIGIGLMLSLKFLALSEIQQNLLPIAMIAGHSISRFATVTFIYTHVYVRDDGSSKSKSLTNQMSLNELLFAGITGIFPLFLMGNLYLLLAVIPVFIVKWLLGRYFVKRIKGYTGDSLGAAQQVTEVVFYLCLNISS